MSNHQLGVDRSGSNDSSMENNNRYFGDECLLKQKQSVRIMFQNVNGLGYSHHSVKSNSIRKLIVSNQVDVMALAETGINWGKV